jgi:hypothetical protein
MFLGHFAVALGAKRAVPAISLGMLFLACQLADLIWPVLVLSGVEHVEIDPGNTAFTPLAFVSYPYSHSFTALAGWGLIAAFAYSLYRRNRGAAVAIVIVVLSHWVLDVITHRPDLPITIGGSARLGLGLWNSVVGTLAVEGAMFAAGIWLYLQSTVARDRTGTIAFWSLVGTLAAINLANLVSPPPPSATAVAIAAEAMWLFVLWAFWIDRHRAARAM